VIEDDLTEQVIGALSAFVEHAEDVEGLPFSGELNYYPL